MYMASHSITCHPIQVNVPHITPARHAATQFTRPESDGRLSWPEWSGVVQHYLPDSMQWSIPVVTGHGVEQLCWSSWSRQYVNHYTTPPSLKIKFDTHPITRPYNIHTQSLKRHVPLKPALVSEWVESYTYIHTHTHTYIIFESDIKSIERGETGKRQKRERNKLWNKHSNCPYETNYGADYIHNIGYIHFKAHKDNAFITHSTHNKSF